MKINKELLKGSTATMILKIISNGDAYGYQIVQELSKKSNKLFQLNEGTLYPILHSLEKSGLLESYRRETESGRERKYYKITLEGKLHLASKISEWKLFTESVNQILTEDT